MVLRDSMRCRTRHLVCFGFQNASRLRSLVNCVSSMVFEKNWAEVQGESFVVNICIKLESDINVFVIILTKIVPRISVNSKER